MSEEVFGVFFRDQGRQEYLVAVEDNPDDAIEEAQRRDQLVYEQVMEEGDVPAWEDYDGMHYVEPISPELADQASAQLERGFAVRVE